MLSNTLSITTCGPGRHLADITKPSQKEKKIKMSDNKRKCFASLFIKIPKKVVSESHAAGVGQFGAIADALSTPAHQTAR